MRVHVICRYNQARSIISAAAIRKFHPELEVISSGVEASTRSGIPDSVMRIASEWRLEIVEEHPTNFQDVIHHLGKEDFILAADSFVATAISELAPELQPRIFSEFALHQSFVAVDPRNMDEKNLRIELAKSISNSLLAAKTLLAKRKQIPIVIPDDEYILGEVHKAVANSRLGQGKKIIDTSFRVSTREMWAEFGIATESFTWQDIENGRSIAGRVLVPKFEYGLSEQILMSRSWRNWLGMLSKTDELLLLAPPLSTHGMANIDCPLSSAHADLLCSLSTPGLLDSF